MKNTFNVLLPFLNAAGRNRIVNFCHQMYFCIVLQLVTPIKTKIKHLEIWLFANDKLY